MKIENQSRYRAPILGVIVLGQSPRADLERAFSAAAPDARVRVRGALDGYEAHEISDLARRRTEAPVLVRLTDGSTRVVGLEWLHPIVERIAREFADEYARLVVVAYAGEFPPCRCDVPVLLPGRILSREVAAMSPRKKVGIVTPVEGEARGAATKWLIDGFHPAVAWASPSRHVEIMRASLAMREADVDVVVLDGLGHEVANAEEFARRCGKPVITAQDVAARAAGEMLSMR
ncbi:MAG: AroM family protein [Cytophagaceae bacterium]|nr:AroM family protein [Gemmatimonadaceae bacterium]